MGHNDPIRMGIIGTGVMGGNHTRVASTLHGCRLVGIYDPASEHAEKVAKNYNITAFPSLDVLCASVDAVVVASPTDTHAEVATQCLQFGCHVLIEKPIAAVVADGEALVALSKQSDRVLMIGHLERYNPAVSVVRSLIRQDELFSFELHRLSPTPPRDRSADIIFDLMIHDIDLAFAFSGAPLSSMTAMGLCVRCGFIDHVTALLRFTNGITAVLTASAVSQQRVRQGRFFTASAQFTIDLASREVSIHRHGLASIPREDGHYYQASHSEQILVPNRDPLTVELEHFLQVIRSGDSPVTTPEDGLAALRLAQQIQDAVNVQLVACQ